MQTKAGRSVIYWHDFFLSPDGYPVPGGCPAGSGKEFRLLLHKKIKCTKVPSTCGRVSLRSINFKIVFLGP